MGAAVGARGFANWSKVSRNGSRIRELDSQTRNCNTRQRPIFTGFSVRRPPTHALQFSDPVSSRTRHIQKPVRKPGTYTPASTHCKDSDPHLCRFTKPGAPTQVQVDWRNNRSSRFQSLTNTPIRQYDFVFGDTRMHASVRASARTSSSPVSYVHRHTTLLRKSRRGELANPESFEFFPADHACSASGDRHQGSVR